MTTPPPGEAGWERRLEDLARAQEWAAELREGIAATLWHAQPEFFVAPWDEISEVTREQYRVKADALIDGPLAPILEALPKVEQARSKLNVLLSRDRAALDLGEIWWQLAQLRAAMCGVVDVNMPVRPLSAAVRDEQARTGVRGSGRCGATEGDS